MEFLSWEPVVAHACVMRKTLRLMLPYKTIYRHKHLPISISDACATAQTGIWSMSGLVHRITCVIRLTASWGAKRMRGIFLHGQNGSSQCFEINLQISVVHFGQINGCLNEAFQNIAA